MTHIHPSSRRQFAVRAAALLCFACAPVLAGCRIERVDGSKSGEPVVVVAPAGVAEPLAWSRDVAVIAVTQPSSQAGALPKVMRQLSRDLCERLTLQGDSDADWHAAVMQLERELSATGYTASEALLSSSDGRWGASVLAPAQHTGAQATHHGLMETAWHYWERGSGLQVLPAAARVALATADISTSEPEPEPAVPPQGSLPEQPGIEDPSRSWVRAPVSPEQLAAATAGAEPSASGAFDDMTLDDAVDAGAESSAAQSSGASAAPTAAQRPAVSSDDLPERERVALLVRLSDGSFRGMWLSGTREPTRLDALIRDAVVGERLFVGALGAVFALEPNGPFQEPRAASRAYERLLQPGRGKAPATVVLTAATLEVDERPGVFAWSSRGAPAGKCRVIEQESAL